MSSKTKLEPIIIKSAHLSLEIKRIIGMPLDGNFMAKFMRVFGYDSSALRIQRFLGQASIPDFYAAFENQMTSLTAARASRLVSEIRLGFFPSNIMSSSPFTLTYRGVLLSINRIEAARIVQFLHDELAGKMRSSKALVSPRFMHEYSADQSNADLISKTHPIFRVNWKGDLVFLPVTRREYQQYRFQQSKYGKLGVQPWMWRGYLEPPKAPESWKKEAAQKVREWVEKNRERWAPVPQPGHALVPVKYRAKQSRRVRVRR